MLQAPALFFGTGNPYPLPMGTGKSHVSPRLTPVVIMGESGTPWHPLLLVPRPALTGEALPWSADDIWPQFDTGMDWCLARVR